MFSLFSSVFDCILTTLLERIAEGWTHEQLMEFLTVKVGLGEEEAKRLLDAVMKALEGDSGAGEE